MSSNEYATGWRAACDAIMREADLDDDGHTVVSTTTIYEVRQQVEQPAPCEDALAKRVERAEGLLRRVAERDDCSCGHIIAEYIVCADCEARALLAAEGGR
jgi:hypothetical protein